VSYATWVRERAIGLALLVGMLLTGACTGGGPHPPTEAPTTSNPSGFVAVPDVVGLSTASAVVAMDDAGLAFEINPVGGSAPLVIRENPEPGTQVRVGSTVTLEASCYPAPCPFQPGSGKTTYDRCTCAAR
jgi:hypothetical protein